MSNVILQNISANDLAKLIRLEVESVLKEQRDPKTTPEQPEDRFLTVEETAKFLQLSVPTIYSKVSRRELPFMKRSKRLYFSEKELIQYLKDGRKQTVYEVKSNVKK